MTVEERVAHVYYCYAADGTLLYVGKSTEPVNRIDLHGHYSSPSFGWFYYCTRVEISEPIPERAALATERAEIARLHPVYNVAHNDDPQPWVPPESCRAYRTRPEVAWVAGWPTERRTA